MSHRWPERTICWTPTWNPQRLGIGLEHLLLTARSADSVIVALDEDLGPFRLTYQLTWNESWQVLEANVVLATDRSISSLNLHSDGRGRWHSNGAVVDELTGCMDIDIWPTPFTNSFPIRRVPLAVHERQEFTMAWVNGLDLTVRAQRQAYTRVADRLYRFETLDGSGFSADLPVDEDGIVLDYPGLFRRVF